VCIWKYQREKAGFGVTLKGLLALLAQRPEFRRLVKHLQDASGVPALAGITEAARPYVIATLAKTLQQPLLIVAIDENEASQLAEALKMLLDQPEEIFFLPDRDALPYERLISDAQTTQQRMNALIALTQRERTALVVCSARVLTQPVIPPQELSQALYELQPGEEIDLPLLLEHLYNMGYQPVTEVEEAGQFSHRGGIVDLFPPTLPRPVHLRSRDSALAQSAPELSDWTIPRGTAPARSRGRERTGRFTQHHVASRCRGTLETRSGRTPPAPFV
jgi:transcription-repair coupling factor (superfamily II helicase)